MEGPDNKTHCNDMTTNISVVHNVLVVVFSNTCGPMASLEASWLDGAKMGWWDMEEPG